MTTPIFLEQAFNGVQLGMIPEQRFKAPHDGSPGMPYAPGCNTHRFGSILVKGKV